jgi:protein ImuB
MLWLCISLPQLPLEALRCEETEEAIVVTVCDGNRRWVICCNEVAERAGLAAGMNYTMALAIETRIVMFERKTQAERAALERLAAWGYQFSSTVIVGEVPLEMQRSRTACIWLEIGASLKLFGGFRKLIEQLENQLECLHYTYRLGIAPTLEAAALLARASIRVAITSTAALYARIRNLPVTRLALAHDIVQQLQMVGIVTIGAALELPRAAVAKRFGLETSDYFDRLVGSLPDPRPIYRLPEHYEATFDFGFEVTSTEGLLFPVRRMLHEFAGFLLGRDTATQRFRLTFVHREDPPTEMNVGLSTPERSTERFFALVREQFQRLSLPSPTCELRLIATEFVSPTALQTDALNGALQQAEEVTHTLDRIAARLGEDRVYGLKVTADHRPEACWTATAVREKNALPEFPERPLWLLPQPQPLQNSALAAISGRTERIEAGWWSDEDVQRDYFILHTSSGADLWVYRDLADENWYLHGFWS